MRRTFALCTVVFSATMSPAMALSPIAEIVCAPTDDLHLKLSRSFGEVQQGTGLRAPDQMMELWSGASGDWTLVMTYASGQSCIIAMGEHWTAPMRPQDES